VDRRKLYLAVVDGWQATSIGYTAHELARFLATGHGVDIAMALDSGSSSTLFLGNGVISQPSDGVERHVANHLAVKYGSLPKNNLISFTCRHTITGCAANDDSIHRVYNVDVALDDGRHLSSGAHGMVEFVGVTPRLACVTAKKSGFLTAVACTQVQLPSIEDPAYDSVVMWEGVDQPDAGVHDASIGHPADASSSGGDARTADGGNGLMSPGGGCCGAGRDRPDVCVVVVAAWFLVRRRGTTRAS
jgi:hypothetical protein